MNFTPAESAALLAFRKVRAKNLADCREAVSALSKALPVADVARAGLFKEVRNLADFFQMQLRVDALHTGATARITTPVDKAREARAVLWAQYKRLPCGEARLDFYWKHKADLQQASRES